MHNQLLREHVLSLLRGGGAVSAFNNAIADMPRSLRGSKPPGSPTRLGGMEHMPLPNGISSNSAGIRNIDRRTFRKRV